MYNKSHLGQRFAYSGFCFALFLTNPVFAYSNSINPVHPNPSHRNDVISLSATAKRKVANDELFATLYVTEQNKNAAKLATRLTTQINTALKKAKTYKDVTASTGAQSTYPRYSKNDTIIGWQGRAAIHIHSKNFDAASKLIAKLQSNMKLENISFNVSEEKRESIQTELMVEASKKLQNRAKALLPVWGASNYKLVNLSLNTQNHFSSPVAFSSNMKMEASSVPQQQFEGGNSEIRVTANGSIQLTR